MTKRTNIYTHAPAVADGINFKQKEKIMLAQAVRIRMWQCHLTRSFKATTAMIGVATLIFFGATGSTWAQASSTVDPCKARADYEAAKKAADLQNAGQVGFANRVEEFVYVQRFDLGKPLPEATVRDWIKRLNERKGIEQGRAERARDRLKKGKSSEKTPGTLKAAEQNIAKISRLIPELERWLKDRKKSDDNLREAAKNYQVTEKDNALRNARATFNVEQARIARIKVKLQGQPQDEDYKRDVTLMLTQARETYVRLLSFLSAYDCFTDVRAFMDDIQNRMSKVDHNLDILRAAKDKSEVEPLPVDADTPLAKSGNESRDKSEVEPLPIDADQPLANPGGRQSQKSSPQPPGAAESTGGSSGGAGGEYGNLAGTWGLLHKEDNGDYSRIKMNLRPVGNNKWEGEATTESNVPKGSSDWYFMPGFEGTISIVVTGPGTFRMTRRWQVEILGDVRHERDANGRLREVQDSETKLVENQFEGTFTNSQMTIMIGRKPLTLTR